ncbi:MAG TPA: septal ring lytic transglycosylase RlpA family protein [Allosphingosinicella sp.]|uniref:septal ring lytic transglycosylase RlpA family protein n=1 Tax=Allosphingosinicella sp. TaxID=2823234 RepID=UPI002EDACFD6
MKIARTHRQGATSLFVLGLAALLPVSAQGEVATAQIAPEPAPVLEAQQEPAAIVIDAPAVEASAPEAEEPKKTLEDSTVIGEGMASYYGAELAGNRTASGERFNPNALTAAHRTLPMGTKLRVTNKANGKSVIVRINDRGPFAKGRIIDVSRAAAEKISMVRSGTARVTLERLS